MNGELDKIDHKILQFLIEDGRASFSHIAREVKLTDVAIKKRIERLRMRGIINSFSAELNLKALGYQKPDFPADKDRDAQEQGSHQALEAA